jgi:hypothetical protein
VACANDDRHISVVGPSRHVRALEPKAVGNAAGLSVGTRAGDRRWIAVDADAVARWFIFKDTQQELRPSTAQIDDRSSGERSKGRDQLANVRGRHRRVEVEIGVSGMCERVQDLSLPKGVDAYPVRSRPASESALAPSISAALRSHHHAGLGVVFQVERIASARANQPRRSGGRPLMNRRRASTNTGSQSRTA